MGGCVLKITHQQFLDALTAMVSSRVNYPDSKVNAPLIDWFEPSEQDAVDFGVLKEPKWDSYSDIAIMQMEWYVEEILEKPFRQALNKLGIEIDEPIDRPKDVQ